MLNSSYLLRSIKLFLFVILILPLGLYSQAQNENNNQNHEITIFVIPSLCSIDWSNPSVLYKTTLNSYLKTIIEKNYYAIGHTIARISSPLLPAPRYFAMCGKVFIEKPELVLIQKNGFGSLGSTMQGHVESEKDIKRGLKLYCKRNRVTYIKFRVNEQSIHRIMEFVDKFQSKTSNGCAPCDLYNGAMWPRYQNEGSGCSAFGMAVLDVANLLPAESSEWQMHVKVPMNLIGGEFNNNKKINISTILNTKSWYVGTGMADVDYVNYNVYDPSVIFDWIKNKRNQNDPDFQVDEENGVPGLIVDRRNLVYDADDPIFLSRKDSDLFVKYYFRKIRNLTLK
jgi:hypothetical protein